MLGKGDFVGVFGVGLVAVDGLGLVGVLCGRHHLGVVARLARLGLNRLAGLLARLGGAGAKVGVSRASHGVANRGGVFKAIELCRCVHLGWLDRVGRLRTASAAIGRHGLAVHGARGLLGEGKGVEESAGRGGGRGAKVKDPDNVEHGEQDKAGAGGLAGANVGVDEVVDAGAGEDEAGSKVAAEGDVIGLDSVGGDDDEDADVDKEGVDGGPPGKLWEVVDGGLGRLNLADDARDEADEPGKLMDMLVESDGRRIARRGR